MSARTRETLTRYFADCDVSIRGNRPTDIQVRDSRFYSRVLAGGSIGFGDSYMNGWRDCADPDSMVSRIPRPSVGQRIGPHYDTTLMAWRANFEKAWPELSETRGERFHRMWRYYLSACAAGFRAGVPDVWQVALTGA